MTIVTAGAETSGILGGTTNNFDSSTLEGITSGTLGSHSSTQFALSNSQFDLTGQGSGIGYSSGHPSSGTLTSLTFNLQDDESSTWSGFSVSVASVWSAISKGDVTAFTNLFFGGNDTFNMQNSIFADSLVGGPGNDTFNFGAYFDGNTVIDGGTGTDTLNLDGDTDTYLGSVTNVEIVNVAAGHDYQIGMVATSTLTVNASALGAANFLSFTTLASGSGSVLVTGGAGNDTFISGAGNDTFNGGGGSDTFDCSNATGGVTVNLSLTTAQAIGGGLGSDTLNSVENINGSQFNDTLTGNAGDNFFTAAGTSPFISSRGVDTFNGGGGFDTVSLGIPWDSTTSADHGVTVDLRTGSAHLTGTDTFISIEKIIGTWLDDTFYGNADDNIFDAGGVSRSGTYDTIDDSGATGGMIFNMTAYHVGGDTLPTNTIISTGGGEGTDTLYNFTKIVGTNFDDTFYFISPIVPFVDGGGGNDTISFENATQALGTVSTDQFGQVDTSSESRLILHDLSTSVENLTGSPLNDLVVGDEGSNVLHGGGGDDTIFGGQGTSTNEGNDTLYGDDGNDALYSGGGENTNIGTCLFDGGPGDDTLVGSTAGTDTATYQDATGGVTVDLSLTTPQSVGGGLGTDTLTSIENLTGSSFDDTLQGNSSDNTLNGGSGNDTASYSSAPAGVNVSLAIAGPQAVGGGQGNDTLISIENLTGSNFDDTLTGNGGDNVISGLAGNDTLDLTGGGNDTAQGGDGDDTINLGAAFTAADKIDGGTGTDTVTLNGNYSAGVTFGAATMVNVELLQLTGGHSYKLTTNDATVAAGQTLTVDGSALGTSDALSFNGSAETNGNFAITGGGGNDTITPGAGNDIVNSGGGNDTIAMGANLTSADQIDGGTGTDTMTLLGNYSAGVTFSATTMVNVEVLSLGAGFNYNLTTNDATVASGQVLTVDASALGASNALTFNGAAETDGHFIIKGGAGNDSLTGGAGSDTITPGAGNDIVHAGASLDTIVMGANLNAADQIDGGTGTDTVTLLGNYSAGVTFSATTMVNVEVLSLGAGFNYNLTTNDATVASGQVLTVDASALGASNALTFNGAAETNGHFIIDGGAGNDVLTGGAGSDNITPGAGNDIVHAGASLDTINMGANLTSADQIDGGTGTDTMTLLGDYSAGLTFAATTMVNVEVLSLGAGFNYNLTTNNATVASGQTLTVDASALSASNSLTFNGAAETDGHFVLKGGAGNDSLTGGAGSDTITPGAGNDIVNAGAGIDTIVMAANLTAADQIDGGTGTDTVTLLGNYSAGVTFSATTMVNVEVLSLGAGFNYNLTTNDATVASGQVLTVDASALGASNALTFNGAAETNGHFIIDGGAGNDVLTGGAGSDNITPGAGNDIVHAGASLDTINMGANLTSADQIDGGTGTDTLTLLGDYSGGVTFSATTMVNVEVLSLGAGFNYNLTTNNATVASGQTLAVDASALGASNALTFNGAAETDGHFTIKSGLGADNLTGGALSDTFFYGSAADSTSTHYDTINAFSFSLDRFDIPGAAGTITGIDTALTTGALNTASFDTDLASALTGHLNPDHAILFTPNSGTLSGQTFLIVDLNGLAGYQTGADLVIHLTSQTGSLATSDFI